MILEIIRLVLSLFVALSSPFMYFFIEFFSFLFTMFYLEKLILSANFCEEMMKEFS